MFHLAICLSFVLSDFLLLSFGFRTFYFCDSFSLLWWLINSNTLFCYSADTLGFVVCTVPCSGL